MAFKISSDARNAACHAVVGLIDGGSGAGTIEIRTGSQPSSPEAGATGTLLATLTFTYPAFGAASGGVATAAAITSDTSVEAQALAGWFRVKDSNGVAVLDGSVTVTGGGGDLTFDSVQFIVGGTCAIATATLTMPQAA